MQIGERNTQNPQISADVYNRPITDGIIGEKSEFIISDEAING